MKDRPHSILLHAPWQALNGPHAAFAEKCGCACVYKDGYGLFGGLSEYTEKAYRDLASIVRPGRFVLIRGTGNPIDYPEWKPLGKWKTEPESSYCRHHWTKLCFCRQGCFLPGHRHVFHERIFSQPASGEKCIAGPGNSLSPVFHAQQFYLPGAA